MIDEAEVVSADVVVIDEAEVVIADEVVIVFADEVVIGGGGGGEGEGDSHLEKILGLALNLRLPACKVGRGEHQSG